MRKDDSDRERFRSRSVPVPPEEEDDEALWGEVADPFDSEEEAETAGEAIRALQLPPLTPEQVAEMERVADIMEHHERRIAELIRQERAKDAKHGLPKPKDPTDS